MIWIEMRRRAVYKRNAAKLTDSETDGLRRSLQEEFIKLQRRGNLFFSLFCGTLTLTGFILGVSGTVNDSEVSLIENVLGLTVAFFMISAIISLVIWCGIYQVYRKKVTPVEMQLSNIEDKEKSNIRDKENGKTD